MPGAHFDDRVTASIQRVLDQGPAWLVGHSGLLGQDTTVVWTTPSGVVCAIGHKDRSRIAKIATQGQLA